MAKELANMHAEAQCLVITESQQYSFKMCNLTHFLWITIFFNVPRRNTNADRYSGNQDD